MPNWCYNSISIEGEPQKMKSLIEVINIFQKQEGEEKMGLMRCLIGLPPDVKMSNYNNQGWYETNIAWFGTKWDFPNDYDMNIDISEDGTQVVIGVSSAWSPPINAFQKVAEKYGVKVEMYYEEPGADFCGKTYFNSDGMVELQNDYEYQEGIYHIEGYGEWYEREFANNLEYIAEEIADDTEPNFMGVIKENYPFLKEEEVEDCACDLEREVVAMTGKEF